MPNIFRKLLAAKLRAGCGYSRNWVSYPIEYTVGLYYADLDFDHIFERAIADGHLSQEEAATPGLREQVEAKYDADKFSEWAQGDMYDSLNDDDGNRSYGPTAAARYGMPFTCRRLGWQVPGQKKIQVYPCSSRARLVKGFSSDIPYFDVKFELAGRGGKHLVVTEFEGIKLQGRSSEMLAEQIEEEHSGISNRWCHYLLAMMCDWEEHFTSRKASQELEYQVAYRVAEVAREFLDERQAEQQTAEMMHL